MNHYWKITYIEYDGNVNSVILYGSFRSLFADLQNATFSGTTDYGRYFTGDILKVERSGLQEKEIEATNYSRPELSF